VILTWDVKDTFMVVRGGVFAPWLVCMINESWVILFALYSGLLHVSYRAVCMITLVVGMSRLSKGLAEANPEASLHESSD
jgi:hypothetical protein